MKNREMGTIRGTIGKVLPLAPSSINPMWQIEKNLPSIAKRAARILKATQPKKKERTTIVVNQGVVFGEKSKRYQERRSELADIVDDTEENI